jgi:DNA (cytosine-5)-methyltransferase 1
MNVHGAAPASSLDPPGAGWQRSPLGLHVPPTVELGTPARSRPVAIDLFAGAGGFAVGLHEAGFHVAAALEFDPWAAITYAINLARPGVQFHFDTPDRADAFDRVVEEHLGFRRPRGRRDHDLVAVHAHLEDLQLAGSGWISSRPGEPGCEHLWVADARNVSGAEILDALGLAVGDVDLVVGGPPCQGFSIAGRRNVMDPRNSLVFEFARLVLELQPRAVMMENVAGIRDMLTPEGLPVVDALCRVLADGGFGGVDTLKRSLLASADAGAALRGGGGKANSPTGRRAPQQRRRSQPAAAPSQAAQALLFADAPEPQP